MASVEEIELLFGPIDGANQVFTTSAIYLPGTVKLVVNGQIFDKTDDNFGFSETGSNEITTNFIPVIGDVLQCFYTQLRSTGGPSGC